MTAFTVWKFTTPEGADHAESLLRRAARDGLIDIIDHAVVSWRPGSKRPDIKHGREDTWRGTGWGAFWGLLFGAIFFVPVLGVAAGAGIGALSAATQKMGITSDQLERIRSEVTEGTSALFVVTDSGDLDRVGERLRGVDMKLIDTNLTEAERGVLLEAFGRLTPSGGARAESRRRRLRTMKAGAPRRRSCVQRVSRSSRQSGLGRQDRPDELATGSEQDAPVLAQGLDHLHPQPGRVVGPTTRGVAGVLSWSRTPTRSWCPHRDTDIVSGVRACRTAWVTSSLATSVAARTWWLQPQSEQVLGDEVAGGASRTGLGRQRGPDGGGRRPRGQLTPDRGPGLGDGQVPALGRAGQALTHVAVGADQADGDPGPLADLGSQQRQPRHRRAVDGASDV